MSRIATLCLLIILTGCSTATDGAVGDRTPSPPASSGTAQAHPDVLSAALTASGDGTWDLAATLSSPYDTPERYADAFRALAPDGTQLDIRVLTHDHADEQPFTRTLTGLTIPDGVTSITVEGRDLVNGWGGDTVTLAVP